MSCVDEWIETNMTKTEQQFLAAKEALLKEKLSQYPDPWSLVPGQESVKRAIVVAAVQGHTVAGFGPSGCYADELTAGAALLGVPMMTALCCPCGNYTDPIRACSCSVSKISQWTRKHLFILRDSAEIHVEISSVPSSIILAHQNRKGYGSTTIEMVRPELKDIGALPPVDWAQGDDITSIAKQAMNELGITGEQLRIIRNVARSIAALAHSENVKIEHFLEAIQYRRLNRLCS